MLNVLLKLKNKKGFTMIEMIVVLVIIAILAAAAIPTMLGYINRARETQFISEARIGFVAAQSVATEMRAMGTTPTDTNIRADARFESLIDPLTVANFHHITVGTDGVDGIQYNCTIGTTNRTVVISATGTSVVAR